MNTACTLLKKTLNDHKTRNNPKPEALFMLPSL